MPRVEIPLAEVSEEGEKADAAGEGECPPGPRRAIPHGKRRQPQVTRADGEQRAPIGNAVVEHETEQVRIPGAHQRRRIQADGVTILRKQLAGDRLQNRESARQCQGNAGERDQESPVAQHDFQQATVLSHLRGGVERWLAISWR